jgi:hypothetical protein
MAATDIDTPLDLQETVLTYLRAWNSDDHAERTASLERSVAVGVEFIDPMKRLVGRDALEAHIADVRGTYPGITFSPGGAFDAHNAVLRSTWIAELDGRIVLRGLDVDDVGPDGRLTRILGFFDKP